MVKKLRFRFILLALLTASGLLAAVVGIINISNARQTYQQVEGILNYLCDNDGVMPFDTSKDDISTPKDVNFTQETRFQVRYYSVLVDSDNKTININVDNIAAVTAEEAEEKARELIASGDDSGKFTDGEMTYGYKIKEVSNGEKLVVVMDCTSYVDSTNQFMLSSIRLSIAGIIIFFILITIFSNFAIRPFARNLENQKRFVTNAGHELKTPLAIISADAEVLQMVKGKNEWTESILKQTKRLSDLVQHLITLAKTGEKENNELVKIDASKIVKESAESFMTLAEQQEKHLSLEIDDNVETIADKRAVAEIVNILVDNAVKYCDDKGEIKVKLTSKLRGRGMILSVSDTYAEGKEEDVNRFFERFYRGDVSHSNKKAGYGIGLSMAQNLTMLCKGKIHADWNDGFITFTVTI